MSASSDVDSPEAEGPGRRVRRRRRGRVPLLAGVAAVVVAAVVGVGALGLGGGGGSDTGGTGTVRAGGTVAVTRGTLAKKTEVQGTLGHGPEVPLLVKAAGTVTWLPQQGQVIRRGDQILRVDDRPVMLLYGILPMFRSLGLPSGTPAPAVPDGQGADGKAGGGAADTGAGDGGGQAPATAPAAGTKGPDVRQLEANLSALGYTGFTVDDTFSANTAEAVKRWQKSLGVPQTGAVTPADVVYQAGAVRIARTNVLVGGESSGEVLTYSSTVRKVVVDASASDSVWAQRGTPVDVDLPDGTTVKGKVAGVGADASAPPPGGGDADGGGGNRAATVPVVIDFADQSRLGSIQSGPVTVRYVGTERKNVLTVPVAALVALAEGGYGLQLADGGGQSGPTAGAYVPVRTGLVADGMVEVSGANVRQGMKVRIPK